MTERILAAWREARTAVPGLRIAERRGREWVEAIFHISRARAKQADRWKHQSRLERSPSEPHWGVESVEPRRLRAEA